MSCTPEGLALVFNLAGWMYETIQLYTMLQCRYLLKLVAEDRDLGRKKAAYVLWFQTSPRSWITETRLVG